METVLNIIVGSFRGFGTSAPERNPQAIKSPRQDWVVLASSGSVFQIAFGIEKLRYPLSPNYLKRQIEIKFMSFMTEAGLLGVHCCATTD
jgi:hypothetical protein